MGRTQRMYELVQVQSGATLPTADSLDFVFNGLFQPEVGALLRDYTFIITTAGGAGTALFTVTPEVRNSNVTLGNTSITIDTDAPQYTIFGESGPARGGKGSGCNLKGDPIAFSFDYDLGTVGTAAVASVMVFWQM